MTTTTSPLRVKSAQEAIDLLYNHFIKNRHRPAFIPQTPDQVDGGYCYAMPKNAVYPRCAIGILTKPSAIRDEHKGDNAVTEHGVYLANSNQATILLNDMIPSFGYRLQDAHDSAAHSNHQSIQLGSSPRINHQSFRAAFSTSLRSICTHYNLEYPGDR